MSKRDLKKYLESLDKNQITVQFLEMYDKFPDVKTYYDFVFNPKEEKLIGEAKAKISNEYFPVKTKRAKLRRSTAQKYIKHFLMLGVDPFAVADLMIFNIETAQKYSAKREIRYSSFYKSMQKSFEQTIDYVIANAMTSDFKNRLADVSGEASRQRWENKDGFISAFEKLTWE
ncbi:MAG: hypothetical protein EOO48_01210 [Flavobacterium sp.]|nr:MAG: hypothetical protein EOO48_01210 [Flavobacterium sp.]